MKTVFPIQVWCVMTCLCSLLTINRGVQAQAPVPSNPIRLPEVLPTVPQLQPRGLESSGEGLNTKRVPEDNFPINRFVESLQGNDAILNVVIGQGRLLTLKEPMAEKDGVSLIAVGDPNLLEFEVLANPRMVRLLGKRAGVTDLSIVTVGGHSYSFEVRVGYDLTLWQTQITSLFPDAQIRLSQIREHLVLEGQARSPAQVRQIVEIAGNLIGANTLSNQMMNGPTTQATGNGGANNSPPPPPSAVNGMTPTNGAATGNEISPQIINMLRVPGVNQVMLQVRIAELNRTGMRQIGADLFLGDSKGNIVGTNINGTAGNALTLLGFGGAKTESPTMGAPVTMFGVFPSSDFEFFLRALRRNSLLTIMAEPNLVAMSGHEASFLAGGQFPVPITQGSGGVGNSVTVQFKSFGVQLNFLPVVLDDEVIRLSVTPEVSSIDYALGTTLIAGGLPVPGLNTRQANTTVELRQGQTLAIAGLLQVQVDASTSRVPGLGDLPYIGPLFSNTSHQKVEKELLVMVTPYLVNPVDCPTGKLPGEDIHDPTDWELYFFNRIENRTGNPHRSTTNWDDCQVKQLRLDKKATSGQIGFSSCP